MNAIKDGWKTTEFWLNVVQQLVALSVVFGAISPQDAKTVGDALGRDVSAAMVLIASTGALVHYVQGRLALKQQSKKDGSND